MFAKVDRCGNPAHPYARAVLSAAIRILEDRGPEAVQARTVAREADVSSQVIYTAFGGMRGLFAAMRVEASVSLTSAVVSIADTDNALADLFSRSWTFCEWALSHPHWYRLLIDGQHLADMETRVAPPGAVAYGSGAATARDEFVRALQRATDARDLGADTEPVNAANQMLSSMHGYLILELGQAFGENNEGPLVLADLITNVLRGLGAGQTALSRALTAATRGSGRRRHV